MQAFEVLATRLTQVSFLPTGQPISNHAYSPYGDPTTAAPDPFGYTSEQTDPTGLLYLRARYIKL